MIVHLHVSPTRLNSWGYELVSIFVSLASRIGLACSKSYSFCSFVSLSKCEFSKPDCPFWEGRVFFIVERIGQWTYIAAVGDIVPFFSRPTLTSPPVPPLAPMRKEPRKIKPTTRLLSYFGISVVCCSFTFKMIELCLLSRPELIHTLALVRFFSQRNWPVFTLLKNGNFRTSTASVDS